MPGEGGPSAVHLCLLFPASLPPGLAPSPPAKLRARRSFGNPFGNRLLCPAPHSLPRGGLGTAGLWPAMPPPPLPPLCGGRDVCRAMQPSKPALPRRSLARNPRLMLRGWHGSFSFIKDFSRGKRRPPVERKSRGSERDLPPAHGCGTGPAIVILAKVKWVPEVKPGAPAEGGERSISGAVQPPASRRVGADRDARRSGALKPQEERSPVPALRGVSLEPTTRWRRGGKHCLCPPHPREGRRNALGHAPGVPKSAPRVGHEAAPPAPRPRQGPGAALGPGPGAVGAERGGSPGGVTGWCCLGCCSPKKEGHSPDGGGGSPCL